MKFHHFWPPLETFFWLPLEKCTISPPLEKILSTPIFLARIDAVCQDDRSRQFAVYCALTNYTLWQK